MLRNLFTFVLCLCLSFFAGRYQAKKEIQEKVTRIETKMQETVDQTNEQLKKEKKDAETKINSLKSAVADGELRLYVRTSNNSSSTCGNTENGAELDRQVAQDLIGITADGDKAIIQLNSCIDLYNKLRNIK
jgi:Tfp pilus assembly protein PilX